MKSGGSSQTMLHRGDSGYLMHMTDQARRNLGTDNQGPSVGRLRFSPGPGPRLLPRLFLVFDQELGFFSISQGLREKLRVSLALNRNFSIHTNTSRAGSVVNSTCSHRA